jgi:TetR/AcrR family transcriptional regulator, cholesterol catabolism regulator
VTADNGGASGKGAALDRRRAVLEIAARVMCEKGYEGASIQDIADAAGLTKAGLYHHIRSKEHLLHEIHNYGMDLFEERVLEPVLLIADPVLRLRECMRRNIRLLTEEGSKEITVILHEDASLKGEPRVQINTRKKRYLRFLESTIAEAMETGRLRKANPKVAAFAFLGMILWVYKWWKPTGPLPADRLAAEMERFFFGDEEVGPRLPARISHSPAPDGHP